MMKQAKNTICLWYDGDAEDAAWSYAEVFPNSSVGAGLRAPGDQVWTGNSSCAYLASFMGWWHFSLPAPPLCLSPLSNCTITKVTRIAHHTSSQSYLFCFYQQLCFSRESATIHVQFRKRKSSTLKTSALMSYLWFSYYTRTSYSNYFNYLTLRVDTILYMYIIIWFSFDRTQKRALSLFYFGFFSCCIFK